MYLILSGTLVSPYCEEIFCEIQLHHAEDVYRGCAPIYYGQNACCPHEFHCGKS